MASFLPARAFAWCFAVIALIAIANTPLCAAASLSTGEDVASFVQEKINNNEVMVFAKSYCPHCKATRQLLKELKEREHQITATMEVIDINLLPEADGPMIQEELQRITGQRTVPNCFIGGKHIGGNSEMQQLASENVLADMIQGAAMGSRDL